MFSQNVCRSYSIRYTSLASASATGGIIGGLFNTLEGHLPFKMWVPYDYTPPFLFWFTSIQELVALIFATIVNIATETTVLGFCLQICAQIEILKHRLQRIKPSEKKETPRISLHDESNKTRLSEHILHHLCIIRFVNKQMIQLFYIPIFFVLNILNNVMYMIHNISYSTFLILYILII